MVSDLTKLVRLARKSGWKVEAAKRRQHLRFVSPTGQVIFAESTPSDYRSIRNTAARLRRAGLPVPHKGGIKPRERKPSA